MNPKYDIYEQIDLYIGNKLSEEELSQFNAKLANDINLQETLEAQKIANELIIDLEMIKLKARMQKDMSPPPPSSPLTSIIVAAISAIVLSSGAYFTYNHFTQTSQTAQREKNNFTKNENFEKIEVTKTASEPIMTKEVLKSSLQKDNHTSTFPNKDNSQLTATTSPLVPVIEKVGVATPIATPHHVLASEPKSISSSPIHPTIDCQKVKLETSAQVDFQNEEAIISINKKVRGGTPPYTFSIDQHVYGTDNRFENVKEGTYQISIKDADNCVSILSKPVIVKYPEKLIDDSFNPSTGNKWSYPNIDNQDATVTIVNKVGLTVFTHNISNGYPSDWDGRDNHGNELDAGNYFFIISFTNNKIVKGHVTIVK